MDQDRPTPLERSLLRPQLSRNDDQTPRSNAARSTPLSSDIEEAIRESDDAIAEHKANDSAVTELLGLIADNADAAYADRSETVTELKDDVRVWMERAQKAQEQAGSVESREEAASRLQALEVEKQDLIQEILRGRKGTDGLLEKRERLKKKLEQLRKCQSELQHRRETDLPTMIFFEKVYRKVSSTTVMASRKSSKVEGFVSKPDTGDVLPFSYDANMSSFERVNKHWDLITQ